jgi:1,4-dihydroxy-2-naphthoyl-CoA hydrolase
MIWFSEVTTEVLNKYSKNTLVEHLGIEFTEVGEDYITAKLPVDKRTIQPAGLLHGGASVTLAESIGSIGAYLCVDPDKYNCVGLEINANHIRSKTSGIVYGKGTPLHIGKKIQVWEIKITDEQERLICVSRITIAVIEKR